MLNLDPNSRIAGEFRVTEAVDMIAATPRIVWAFAFTYGLLIFQLGPGFLTGPAGIPSGFLLIVILLMVRRWIKLRNQPRPGTVSLRFLRGMIATGVLFGLAWGTFTALVLFNQSPESQAIILIIAFFAAVNTVTIGFWTAICFSIPSLAVSLVGTIWAGAMEPVSAIAVYLIGVVIIAQGILNRRRLTLSNIRLSLENREALDALGAEKTRTEAANTALKTVSDQLAKYISPQLYNQITEKKQEVRVVSQRKKLTIFFSDVASFTEITDQLEPEDMTTILNRYLTEMAEIATAHGANFDKFMGDGIIVYFGDPDTQGTREDAAACVRMAIAMQQRMADLNAEWMAEGLPRPLEIRMGINTGYVTVGNFGSDQRMDYTIIGGEVNLASRLEYHADIGGILLSHSTYMLVKDWVEVEESQPIQIRGFARPVKTYRLRRPFDAATDGIIHRTGPGFKLTIDPARIRREDRDGALQTLRKARAALDATIDEL